MLGSALASITKNTVSIIKSFQDEVIASSISHQAKNDFTKVISCLIYIIENDSYLIYAVDNLALRSIYNDHPYAYSNDFHKRTLRDPNRTSFHLAVRKQDNILLSGKEWIEHIMRMMEQIAAIITALPTDERRLEFAQQFVYDKDVGCLEARIKPAIDWAAMVLLFPIPSLDFLMQECVKHYPANAGMPLAKFAEGYLIKHNHKTCLHEGKTIAITHEILQQYVTNILGENNNAVVVALPSNEIKAAIRSAYLAQAHAAKIIRGQQGMLQHHFTDLATAQTFLTWLKSQSIFDSNKCKITKETASGTYTFMIRLSEAQIASMHTKLDEIIIQSRLTESQVAALSYDLMDSIVNNPAKFAELIRAASYDEISAVITKVADGWKIFHVAAAQQSNDFFHQLLKKCSSQAVSLALVQEYYHKGTLLHVAGKYQSSEALMTLVAKASSDALSQVLVKPDASDWNPVHHVAFYHSSEAFMALINKVNPEALSEALAMLANDHENALRTIIRSQPTESFACLLSLINFQDCKGINDACLNNKIIKYALLYQTSDAVAKLLNMLNQPALTYQLKKHLTPSILMALASNLLFTLSWQEPSLIRKLFDTIGKELRLPIYQAWISGITIPAAVLADEEFDYICSFNKESPEQISKQGIVNDANLYRTNKDWLNLIAMDESKQMEQLHAEKAFVTCGSGKKIALDSIGDAEIDLLWRNGLSCVLDYRRLQKLLPDHMITQVANDMQRANLLYVGCRIERQKRRYSNLTATQQLYVSAIEQGNALIKIIKPANWPDFCKQLQDFNYRPALRHVTDKSQLNFKVVHRTNEIVAYKSHDHTPKIYTDTKKQSATFLSKKLNTPAFGEHDPSRPLVGILYDMGFDFEIVMGVPTEGSLKPHQYMLVRNDDTNQWQLLYIDDNLQKHPRAIDKVTGLEVALNALSLERLKKITPDDKAALKKLIAAFDDRRMNKALFIKDTGTYYRHWITKTPEEAKKYFDRMKSTLHTDLATFREEVEKNPQKLTEILRKFTRTGIRAIFFRTDTLDARALARQYRDDILRDFNIDLPILHYDSLTRKMRVYTSSQQIDDALGYSVLCYDEKCQKNSPMTKADVAAKYGNEAQFQLLIEDALKTPSMWPDAIRNLEELRYKLVLQKVGGLIEPQLSWHVRFFNSSKASILTQIFTYIECARLNQSTYLQAYQKSMREINSKDPKHDNYYNSKKLREIIAILEEAPKATFSTVPSAKRI
jgi:ankyrin repeat protein